MPESGTIAKVPGSNSSWAAFASSNMQSPAPVWVVAYRPEHSWVRSSSPADNPQSLVACVLLMPAGNVLYRLSRRQQSPRTILEQVVVAAVAPVLPVEMAAVVMLVVVPCAYQEATSYILVEVRHTSALSDRLEVPAGSSNLVVDGMARSTGWRHMAPSGVEMREPASPVPEYSTVVYLQLAEAGKGTAGLVSSKLLLEGRSQTAHSCVAVTDSETVVAPREAQRRFGAPPATRYR